MLRPLLREPLKQPLPHRYFLQNLLSEQSFEQNFRTICNRLLEFTREKSLLNGQSIHAHAIKCGVQIIPHITHHLINFYAKLKFPRQSEQLFGEALFKSATTWSSIISCFAQNELPMRAFEYLRFMLRSAGLYPDDHIFPSVTKSCAMMNDFRAGQSVHCLAVKVGYDYNVFVGSAVADMYAKCGNLVDARKMFDEIPGKNVVSWSGMIYGYAQMGQDEEALELFKEALIQNLGVNDFTFSSVIRVCGNSTLLELGLVEEGKHYFWLMKEQGIEPGDQHYASMVDLLGRAGKLQDALEIIKEMPMQPTESVWGALLTGCRIHNNTELAAYVADRVFELGPVSPGLHVLLSNAYAAAGRYKEAAMARKMLRDCGVKKETGLSWVEEGNRIYTFAAGDRTNVKSEEIYRKLEELGEDMARAGYVTDTSYVLQEVGADEKIQSIRYHSERLAIAFALISFPPKRPIRVMKNLRVCGDCHTAIKFMSKCTGRIIIVRDNNIFHRFEGGKCSCGDYW